MDLNAPAPRWLAACALAAAELFAGSFSLLRLVMVRAAGATGASALIGTAMALPKSAPAAQR
jgi:hypothetical protein